MFTWESNLKNVKQALRKWLKDTCQPPSQKSKSLEEHYRSIEEVKVEERHMQKEKELTHQLFSISRKEENLWWLKPQSLWLKGRGLSTSFFHMYAKARESWNRVKWIAPEGRPRVSSFEDIKTKAYTYYKTLYNADQIPFEQVNEFLWVILNVITPSSNQKLIADIKEDEAKEENWLLDLEKAPRRDGFSISFFYLFWLMIKNDLLRMLNHTRIKKKSGDGTNSSFLTLIPKEVNLVNFSIFWPISLCIASYKILTKIIANHLKPFLPSFIYANQGGFM